MGGEVCKGTSVFLSAYYMLYVTHCPKLRGYKEEPDRA